MIYKKNREAFTLWQNKEFLTALGRFEQYYIGQ